MPIIFAIAIQVLWIYSVGTTVTCTGWILFILQALLYLTNIFWAVPKDFANKKYLRFFCKFFVEVLLYVILRAIIVFRQPWSERFWEMAFSREQLLYASIHIFVVLGTSFFVGFFLLNQANAISRELSLKQSIESLSEKRRLESIIHQMQLNPHLLFNILNLIKLESASKLPGISHVASLLAELQKIYLFNPAKERRVVLMDEVKGIEIYVELERYARNQKIHIDIRIVVPENELRIPHLLLLTLIENLFKYGDLTEEKYPAQIHLQLVDNTIKLHTWNLKRTSVIKGNGLGQQNVIAILNHQYAGKHSLIISDTEYHYELKLEIVL
ncbi:histidine kinase [Sphingobacterium thalpophilum]|uniref:histidine kinase n=1 Tax=Sphingobacterium thalpophilum TaxID=259 RepID=UPI003D95A722